MASAIHPTVGRWRRVDNAAGLSTRPGPAHSARASPRTAWMASAIHPAVGTGRRVDNAARLIHVSLPGTQRPGAALAPRGWLRPSTLRLAGGVGWITPQAYPRVPIRHTAPRAGPRTAWMASAIHPTVGTRRRVDNAAGLSTRTDSAPAPRAGPRTAWMASAIHSTVCRWRRVDNAARLIHAYRPGTSAQGLPSHHVDGFGHPPYGWQAA